MFTRFEEYAAASMLGDTDSPPRLDGKLYFTNRWERDVFGLALSLSKAGCFEWEDFRQSLIGSIARWESAPADCAARQPSQPSPQALSSARAVARAPLPDSPSLPPPACARAWRLSWLLWPLYAPI